MITHRHSHEAQRRDMRGGAGFIRPGVAALVFALAAVAVLVLAPETLLPDWPPRLEAPAEEAVSEPVPAPEADGTAEETPPRQETESVSERKAGEVREAFDDAMGFVRRQVDKARDLPSPLDLIRAGEDGAEAATSFADGPSRPVPALDLGMVLRPDDGRVRWGRLTDRYPGLADLEPVLVRHRFLSLVPTRRLMAVGASLDLLSTMCKGLEERGTSCDAITINTGDIATSLGSPGEAGEDGAATEEYGALAPPRSLARLVDEPAASEEAAGAFRPDATMPTTFRLRPSNPGDRQVRIVAVGDVMMGSDYPGKAGLNPALRPGADLETVLEPALVDVMRAGDITFLNLEGVLRAGGRPSKTCTRCFAFRSPPHYADFLRQAGVDVVSLANNHSGDFGWAGRRATLRALGERDIAGVGLRAPLEARTASLTSDSGLRVAFAAFSPFSGSLDMRDIPAAAGIVRDLETDNDVTVVSVHGGAEGPLASRVGRGDERYLGENRGDMRAFARAMVDAGADLILGHGPHVPRALEIRKDRLIAYSLGNFWTYTGFLSWGSLGLGPVLDVTLDAEGRLVDLALHSTRQAGLGVPRIDPLQEAARFVLDRTARDFPSTFSRLRAVRIAAVL